MRITYGRTERMMRFRELLEQEHLEYFLPMRYEFQKTGDWDVKKECVPAVNGLIFIRSTQEMLTRLKMTRREFEPMRYWTNHLSENEDDKVLVVPDSQMNNFKSLYTKRIKKSQCVVVELEGFAAVAIAFVPPLWLQELTESEYHAFMHNM